MQWARHYPDFACSADLARTFQGPICGQPHRNPRDHAKAGRHEVVFSVFQKSLGRATPSWRANEKSDEVASVPIRCRVLAPSAA